MKNKCKLCDSNLVSNYFSGLYKTEKYEYLNCKKCETIFLNNNLTDKYLHEYYSSDEFHSDNHYNSNQYFKDREKAYENKYKKILTWVDIKSKILDYWCWDASFIKFLQNKWFNNVSWYEFDDSVQNKLKKWGINIIDFESDNQKFDIITVFDVIEHVQEPEKLFNDLYTKLNEGGTIVYTTGVYSKYFDKIDKWYCSWINYPQHLWVFSKQSFHYLNKNKNLNLIKFWINWVWFNSNTRIILWQIKNIFLHIFSKKKRDKSKPWFPWFNWVYIFKKWN